MTESERFTKSASELAEEWFGRVWNEGDETMIHELIAPDCQIDGIGLTERGPGAFAAFRRSFNLVFDGLHIDIIEMVGKDDFVMGHCRFSAKHRKSGKDVDIEFSFSATFENGKIVKARHVVDYTRLLSQVGVTDDRLVAKVFEN